jgi:hypothetical protein
MPVIIYTYNITSLQSNKDYVAPHAAGVTFAMGIAAIWPTLYSYGISILPVSRTSSLLACIGLSYEVSYHIVTAYVYYTVVHVQQLSTTSASRCKMPLHRTLCSAIH